MQCFVHLPSQRENGLSVLPAPAAIKKIVVHPELKQVFREIREPASIRKALAHRPEDPQSPAYLRFREQTQRQLGELMAKYNLEL